MEVKLEDLMKAKTGIASADVTPDNLPSAEVMTAQVEKVVNDLNPEERAQVDKIKDELDLTDSTAILRFGAPAQQKIAEFSDSVLSQVRTKDSGPVGELFMNNSNCPPLRYLLASTSIVFLTGTVWWGSG